MTGPPEGDGARLPIDPEIFGLRPWYHDFAALGLRTDFERGPLGPLRRAGALARERRAAGGGLSGLLPALARSLLGGGSSHRLNQPVKEAVLLPLLRRGLDLVPRPDPSCLELFCADGYYACHLARLRPEAFVLALDREPRHVARAKAACNALSLGRVHVAAEEVEPFVARIEEPFDLVLCAGGLYHLSDPPALLAELRRRTPGILVLQSVVSLEHEEPDYFEAPAPGWRHGSRFSHARLTAWLEEAGWQVLESARNELPGNRRPRDRGSSYFLCSAPGTERREQPHQGPDGVGKSPKRRDSRRTTVRSAG